MVEHGDLELKGVEDALNYYGKFRVSENDGHNPPTIHVFRDEAHAKEYLTGYQDEEFAEEVLEYGESTDDGCDTWALYSPGEYHYDHTKKKKKKKKE